MFNKLKNINLINKIKGNSIFKLNIKKIYTVIFLAIFTWIISSCILDSTYELNPLIIILSILVVIMILCYVYKNIKNKDVSNKKTWLFYLVIASIMSVFQFVIGYLVRTDPSWDLGLVIQSANEIISFGHSTDMAVYYIQAPNNIFITLILAIIFKISNIFGIKDLNISMIASNILCIQLSILFLFKIVKKVFNNITACFTLIITFMFLPIYPYTAIMYTDTTSMLLPIGFLYCVLKINDNSNNKKEYLYYALIGLLMFVSFKLKVTAIIVVIAFVINELLNGKFLRVLKILLVCGLIFITMNYMFTAFLKRTNIMGIPYEKTKEIPFTHFVMMGTYGSGAFSAEEWQFTLRLPDYETRKNENIRVIKERLKNYKIQGYIKFLNYKIKSQTWGSGTYDFESILNSYNIDNNIAHQFLLTNGSYYKYIFYYCQIYHFSMLIFILISCFYTIKNKNENSILSNAKLSIFGLLIFLLIWETRSRYMLNFIPVYILVGISGIEFFEKDFKKLIKKIMY